MFDLIVNGHRNTTRRDIALLAISWALHTLVIGAVVLLPLLFATDHVPAVPEEVLTYVDRLLHRCHRHPLLPQHRRRHPL